MYVALASANLSLKCDWRIIDDDEWGSDHLPALVTYNESSNTEETHSVKINIKEIKDGGNIESSARLPSILKSSGTIMGVALQL